MALLIQRVQSKKRMNKTLLSILFVTIILTGCKDHEESRISGKDWPVYGGNKEGNRYSSLDQINISNVKNLQVAWMYNAADSSSAQRRREIQCQPIVINGVLYGTTPELKLFALDAGNGNQLWIFSPDQSKLNSNRGVAYWENGNDKRILYTAGPSLYCINASNGKIIESFGTKGTVDLHEGLATGINRDISDLSVAATSPGVVYKNIFIIGSTVSESSNAAPGHVRAFDIVTGKLKWVFHTIPHPGEFGYDTWPRDAYTKFGGANNWSGLTVDEKRGAVFFGTGSPSFDFYGGDRKGTNLFANCVVSLNAETGKLNWYYQVIHHDLWDRDIPCPPNLTTIKQNGKIIDVVVQATKDGLVYVLDRDKGTSIFPVEERAVPVDGLPGEHPWPTQKYPLKPLPLSRQVFTEADISDISPEANAYIKDQFLQYRSDNKFTPQSIKGTLLFGYSGGAEWGGNAVDPDGIFYQNANDNPWVTQMIDTADLNNDMASASQGQSLYMLNCAACHGQDRKGSGPDFPNLTDIKMKRTPQEIHSLLKAGSGRMPSFQRLSNHDLDAIVNFLLYPQANVNAKQVGSERVDTTDEKNKPFGFKPAYAVKVWKKLFDLQGYPGVKPPWGTLNAIDLNTGDYLWRVPLGEFPELTKKGIPVTGTESYGAPIVTAGGLIFIAGTRDEKIRAFDKKTGEVVWEYQLPAGGFATPITYAVNGKQYLVIAAGGGRGLKPGGNYIAFTLK